MDKELIAGQMEECILVSGEIIKCTEKGYLLGVMEESIYFNFQNFLYDNFKIYWRLYR